MSRGDVALGLACPKCSTELEHTYRPHTEVPHFSCPSCGSSFRLKAKSSRQQPTNQETDYETDKSGATTQTAPLGSCSLWCRVEALRVLEWTYYFGMTVGSSALLLLGGFVPVVRGWLENDVERWGDITRVLGGVNVSNETQDPDGDLGPVLAKSDAPRLFSMVELVARRLGVKPPGQIRLTYLPCCGVVAWNRDRCRALIIGLPLLRVLSQAEIRAVVAHELAHLARGDATRAARSARFIEGLELALDRSGHLARGPLGAWASFCYRLGSRLIEPVARGQESRADRLSASIAGGGVASSALVKVAMVQPLFREVLERYDPTNPEIPNLYAFFRTFWYRLPAEVHTEMRLRILTERHHNQDPEHPPLPDRLASLQAYPDHPPVNGDALPATSFLGDLEVIEQMLHNRLFGIPPVEASIYHRNGT